VALGGGQFYPVELSPDNRWLIGILSAQSAVLFDLRTTRRVPLPRRWGCWAFSPDCRWLAFPGTTNYAIKIWDLEGGRERVTIQGHNWQIQALRFSPDSKLLASASWDNDVGLWSVEQGGLVHGLLRGHQAGAWQVRFSSDGRTLMTGSDDLTMRWWSVATGQEMLRFQNVHRNLFWNIGDRLLVWQDTQGSNHVTTLPTLAEIDAAEAQQAKDAELR
jgi:WD40 repeat protein